MTDLEWLVDCARCSPSAANAQRLRFILTGHGATCQQLFFLTRWAAALKDWNGPEAGERPTGFIVILMPVGAAQVVSFDAGIAAQSIQLAATSRGWGCCILHNFDRQAVPALLHVPSEMEVALVLGLGIAREQRVIAQVPDNGNLTYWRDAANVHHVPKLALDTLIVAKY